MREWSIHPAAQSELEGILEHYLAIDGDLATDFDRHYRRHREIICGNPLLYRIRRFTIRRANLSPSFGEYYIAYLIWQERVIILAIGHAKRRPYYWRSRVSEAQKLT